jgi:hypothetical protein
MLAVCQKLRKAGLSESQVGRLTEMKAGRQTDRRACWHTVRNSSRLAYRLADSKVGMLAGKQTD